MIYTLVVTKEQMFLFTKGRIIMTKRSIVHIEIPAKAPKEAQEFYGKLFGWEMSVVEEFDYHSFMAENTGGAFPAVGEQYKRGDVTVYIGSEDLDADLAAIEKAGGKRVGDPMPVPGFGRLVHFSDPTGNVLALWQEDPSAQ
jgi:predicted enzyme related to lactoylglutathione lyase